MNPISLQGRLGIVFRICSCGHAFLELAIALPVLILLGFAALEASLVLREYETATALSRELSSLAYRECVAESTIPKDPHFDMEQCLAEVVLDFRTQVGNISSRSTFVVSVYIYDEGTNSVSNAIVKKDPNPAVTTGTRTKFSKANFTADLALAAADRSYRTKSLVLYHALVIGEVWIPYDQIFKLPQSLDPFSVEELYATTII